MSAAILDPPHRAARPPGPTIGRLVAVELRKMVDTRAGFWLLVGAALIGLATVTVKLIWSPAHGNPLDDFYSAAIAATGVLLPVIGILAATSEWSQRTALTTFSLVPRRERVFAAKLLAGLVLALLTAVACLLAAVLATALAPAVGAGSASWHLPLADVGRGALHVTLGLLAGLAFGVALMASAPAIVAYLLLPFLFSALANGIPGFASTAEWLDAVAAMARLIDGTMTGSAWAHLATACGLWIALPLAIGLVRLRRREVA
jgi:ABC-2 type transport system permease protein